MPKTFCSRKFFSLLLSSTISMVVVSVLVLSDSVIAGVMLGSSAVAAICLITPAYSLAAFVGNMVSLGVPILYNRAMGKFDKDSAQKTFSMGLTLSLAVGLFLFVVFMLFGDAYLEFYGATPEILALAKPYFFWYKFTILLLPLIALMLEMVLADGDEWISTLAGIVQVVGNIGCSILFCHFMGIAGIGLGSVVGTALAILITFFHLVRPGNSLKLGFYFSKKWLVDIVKYSSVDAGTYLFAACFLAIMNKFITYAYGPEWLVLGAVIIAVKDLQLVFDGIGAAFTPLMNIYLGEQSYEGVKRCYKLSLRVSVIEGVAMTVLLAAFAPLIARLYDIDATSMWNYAVNGIRIEALGLPFFSLLFLVTSYHLLVNKVALGFVVSGLRELFVAAPVCIAMGSIWGVYGMFVGVAVSPALAYVFSDLYVRLRYGKQNYPLLLANELKGFRHAFYEFKLSPENIIGVQKQTEHFLIENGIPAKTVMKVKLLIEELYMLVYEKNGENTPVYAECTVIIRDDGVQMITKDDGVLFDLSSEDVVASSITEFMVSGYMEKLKDDKMYLTTMSYNRNVFKVNRK